MTTQEILNLNTTKTEKIKKLLEIGLTRVEVARALGVGYGFVQNVYARVYGVNSRSSIYDLSKFKFNRKFGVEIKFFGVTSSVVKENLNSAGISLSEASRSYRNNDEWKLTMDGSINGPDAHELVSNPLRGSEGLLNLRMATAGLRRAGAKVNKSCGVHVHLDASDLQLEHWKNLYINYIGLERLIDEWMPVSRRANNNIYCKSFDGCDIANIESANNLEEIEIGTTNQNRYFKLNTRSFWVHGTVEFRQHGGTIDFEKISNWVYFLARLVDYSKHGRVADATWDSLNAFLPEENLNYFRYRKQTLAA